jgi:RNase P subunit RPR2|tara:strand:+ start:9868 stop:10104 length:237 start_codon:yes stop_codon:yes gene_type:complete
MKPKITQIPSKINQRCRMCRATNITGRKEWYHLVSAMFKVEMDVCKPCGIREYYGNKGRESRNYKKGDFNECGRVLFN